MKAILMVGAALLAGAAFADKVTLKSGSFLTGEAGLIQEGKLLFKSDDLGDLKIDILFFCLIHTDLSRIIPAVPAVKNDYLIFRCYISAGYKFLQILTEQHKYRQKK